MRRLILLIILCVAGQLASGQYNGPKELTPQVLQKLKAEIESQVPDFKKELAKQGFAISDIEFILDTFRIEQLATKRMDVDNSTAGMNRTIEEMTADYDKLMNRYYNRLLKSLKPADQKVLITAQKAWLTYRDAEAKLIWKMTDEKYSGGGTIQSNLAWGSYSGLVIERTKELFHYYKTVLETR